MDAIFNRINFRRLRVLGAGSYNIAFSDGNYAIKVGKTETHTVEGLREAYELGFGIEVIDYKRHVLLPPSLLNRILKQRYPSYGSSPLRADNYLVDCKYADILITELVKPYLSHRRVYSRKYQDRAYKIADQLSEAYRQAGGYWGDDHPWNMGYNNQGKLVILDL